MSPDVLEDGEWVAGPGGVRRWDNGSPLPRETYRAALAERYGPAPWWSTPPPGSCDPDDIGPRRLWEAMTEAASFDGRIGEVA